MCDSSFSICLLAAFRLALLSVASAYPFLLSVPPVLHGGEKYQVRHNVAPDILSVRRSSPRLKAAGRSPVWNPFPAGYGLHAQVVATVKNIDCVIIAQSISIFLSVASLSYTILTFYGSVIFWDDADVARLGFIVMGLIPDSVQ